MFFITEWGWFDKGSKYEFFALFSTLASAIALASVLEVRMYVAVYLTHFEVCLEPYSS